MGFVLDGLDAEAYDRQYKDSELIRRISAYFRPHVREMVIVAVVTAIGAGFPSISAILISRGVDQISQGGDTSVALDWVYWAGWSTISANATPQSQSATSCSRCARMQ